MLQCLSLPHLQHYAHMFSAVMGYGAAKSDIVSTYCFVSSSTWLARRNAAAKHIGATLFKDSWHASSGQ